MKGPAATRCSLLRRLELLAQLGRRLSQPALEASLGVRAERMDSRRLGLPRSNDGFERRLQLGSIVPTQRAIHGLGGSGGVGVGSSNFGGVDDGTKF